MKRRNASPFSGVLFLGLVLATPFAAGLEMLDEESLSIMHLEGLDAPAAGALRSPVAGVVLNRSVRTAKDSAIRFVTEPDAPIRESSLAPPMVEVVLDSGFSSNPGISQIENLQAITQNSSRPLP